jgi:beta-glucosidase
MRKTINLALSILVATLAWTCTGETAQEKTIVKDSGLNPLYLDHTKPLDERIADLISRMTLEEKVSQLMDQSQAIPRLDIPYYSWWGECLHGVARFGRATVFPQAIGLAATFDEDLVFRVASAISDEARAKFRAALRINNYGRYIGLTFWTPNINLFRDPRWGRGQETYGEDPYLTSRIGVAFVKGIQGDHPKYLKAAACAKHYVVHSGPEGIRHSFNAQPSKKDFYETYLPAFESLVKEAKVEAVMCAYNRTYDEPCCGSSFLLRDILRKEWNFEGHIVSDCWALHDFHEHHKVTSTPAESVAKAIKSGVNLNCGDLFHHLLEAADQGLITEQDIDEALSRLLRTRFRLGLFDPEEENPYNSISSDVVRCQEHQRLAREAAAKSVVLLKNNRQVLPLSKNIGSLFILGPNATSSEVLLGNYHGLSDELVTVLEGITGKVSIGTKVEYRQGFFLDRENVNPMDWASSGAKAADAMIVVMGITTLLEGEEGESIASPFSGDRKDIGLPDNQIAYLEKLREGNDKPIIVILTGGSPIAAPEVHELADAVLFVWYPGEQGGRGVADILFGDQNPSGRLPITFPRSIDQLPPYEDYSMKGRTYRYMEEQPLYPFGFGLNYTRFLYSDLKMIKSIQRGQHLKVKVQVTNGGEVFGEEVVQIYLTDLEASVETPIHALKGFERVGLEPGESKKVTFTITPDMMSLVTKDGKKLLEPGTFQITIGGSSPGGRSEILGAAKPVVGRFSVQGM